MSIVDLASDQHEWLEANVAGADQKVRMYPLHIDLQRGTRTVLVEYPQGWSRAAVGTQPAGEELYVLSGEFGMSGHRAAADELLLSTPRALRADTAVEDVTRAVVMYSGPGGGWVGGQAEARGVVERLEVGAGFTRESREGLVGHLERVEELPEEMAEDSELIWIEARRYAFVPRGGIPPQLDGPVLLRGLPRA